MAMVISHLQFNMHYVYYTGSKSNPIVSKEITSTLSRCIPNILNRKLEHNKSHGAMHSDVMSFTGEILLLLPRYGVFYPNFFFFGLGALKLTKAKIKILDSQYLKTL